MQYRFAVNFGTLVESWAAALTLTSDIHMFMLHGFDIQQKGRGFRHEGVTLRHAIHAWMTVLDDCKTQGKEGCIQDFSQCRCTIVRRDGGGGLSLWILSIFTCNRPSPTLPSAIWEPTRDTKIGFLALKSTPCVPTKWGMASIVQPSIGQHIGHAWWDSKYRARTRAVYELNAPIDRYRVRILFSKKAVLNLVLP